MNIKFWGAAGTVTGSMHLLQLDNGKNILLDCGLYQGREDFADDYNSEFPVDPADIDILILSHAHIDHSGNIPQLVKKGFQGRIFCTHATYDLCTIMLEDSARIQESNAYYENRYRKKKKLPEIQPNYTTKDVRPALKRFYTLPYDDWFDINPEVSLMFRDAGHMLGSATVSLKIKEKDRTIRFGFTGDVGRVDSPILRDPDPMPQADYLICESTYGGKDHEVIAETEELLFKVMHETCVVNKGKLIIPAFSVGRTQNIVYILDKMETAGRLPRIPVYVDSPLSVNATRIFELHPECFDQELMDYMHVDPNPFGFNNLHYIRRSEESRKLNDHKGPAIIISSSGMITAGRILHHLANHIEDPKNTLLIVGYCADGTLGEKLVNGADRIRIYGKEYKVNASVQRLNSMSAHAGQSELTDFLVQSQDKSELKNLFLVHGAPEKSERFKDHISAVGYQGVTVPKRGEVYEL